MGTKPEIFSVGRDDFDETIVREETPVLLLCMPRDERFDQQITVVTEAAQKITADLKICLLQESFIDEFKKKYAVRGTPTFLILHRGKEKSRLLGLTDEAMLHGLIAEACPSPTSIKNQKENENGGKQNFDF